MTNLVLALVVALGALYAVDRAGWLPRAEAPPARSDTTHVVEIAAPPAPREAEPAPQASLEADPDPDPVPEELAASPRFQEARLAPDGAAPDAPSPEVAPDPVLVPNLEPEAEAASAASPDPAMADRSAALVRRMLSLYRRNGARR